MKKAIITVTFEMENAWDETDVAETGLRPAEGVYKFLQDEGFITTLVEEAPWFGLKLLTCEVREINEQSTITTT